MTFRKRMRRAIGMATQLLHPGLPRQGDNRRRSG